MSKTQNSQIVMSLRVFDKLKVCVDKQTTALLKRKLYNWLLENPFYEMNYVLFYVLLFFITVYVLLYPFILQVPLNRPLGPTL